MCSPKGVVKSGKHVLRWMTSNLIEGRKSSNCRPHKIFAGKVEMFKNTDRFEYVKVRSNQAYLTKLR